MWDLSLKKKHTHTGKKFLAVTEDKVAESLEVKQEPSSPRAWRKEV